MADATNRGSARELELATIPGRCLVVQALQAAGVDLIPLSCGGHAVDPYGDLFDNRTCNANVYPNPLMAHTAGSDGGASCSTPGSPTSGMQTMRRIVVQWHWVNGRVRQHGADLAVGTGA